MVRLVIDSSLSQTNLALKAGGERYSMQLDSASQQTERLVSEVDALLKRACVDYGDITELVSVVGPGSFTGIRVGLAAARALLLAYPKIESCSVSSLYAMAVSAAAQCDEGDHLLVMNKAGKGELYAQRFLIRSVTPAQEGISCEMREDSRLRGSDSIVIEAAGEPWLGKPQEIAMEAGDEIAGNGLELLPDALRGQGEEVPCDRINGEALLHIPTAAMLRGAPEPLYIRAPDAKPQKK